MMYPNPSTAVRLVFAGLLLATPATAQDAFWKLNDGPYGGSVSALVALPNGAVYAASDAGLSVGHDAGMAWSAVDDGPPAASISQLVAMPDGELMLLDADSVLVRSLENRSRWIAAMEGLPDDSQITTLTAGFDGLPYVGLANGNEVNPGALYRFDPEAGRWIDVGFAAGGVFDIAHADGVMLVSSWTGSGPAIYRTEDEQVWEPGEVDVWYEAPLGELTITPHGTAFAGGWLDGGDVVAGLGLYRSLDGGRTWAALDRPQVEPAAVLELLSDGAGSVYIETLYSGSLRSTDDGATWDAFPYQMQALTSINPDTVFVGTRHTGVIRSTDAGATWQNASTGLGPAAVAHVVVAPNGTIYTSGSHVYKSAGTSWAQMDLVRPLSFFSDVLLAARSGHIFVADGRVLQRSSDDGESWRVVSPDTTKAAIRDLAEDSNGTLYAGTNHGAYRSFDLGDTWHHLAGSPNSIMALAVGPNDELFTGADAPIAAVHRSLDGGESWQMVGDWGERVFFVEVTNQGTLLAGTKDRHIFRSKDSGDSWMPVDLGLIHSYSEVRSFAENGQGMTFIGTDDPHLVLRSDDDGQSWEQLTSGLPDDGGGISSLALDRNGVLYGAMLRGGLYRSVRSTIVATERAPTPAEPAVVLNTFPKPVQSRANVRFYMARPGDVMLNIFDATGREVDTLFNGYAAAGWHDISWNASGFAVGVYFCALSTPDEARVEAMIVVK